MAEPFIGNGLSGPVMAFAARLLSLMVSSASFGRVMDCVRTSMHFSDKSRPSHVMDKSYASLVLAVCIMVFLWPGNGPFMV